MTLIPIRILVIEDDPQMQKFLGASLTSEGYRAIEATTGREGLDLARANNPDLVLLDLGLPDTDGMDVARLLRAFSTRPIIVISARGQEEDKVRALDAGADDYLTKPFGARELMARIRVALRHDSRRAEDRTEPVIRIGGLEIDLDRHRVTSSGNEVHLTPNEYKLFAYLMKHAGKVLTHRQLLKEVWGAAYDSQTHYLRVYMAQLRHKLEADPARPKHLVTEAGVGYRLKTDE
jgi:two-component system KDP operon response regulator KdpE